MRPVCGFNVIEGYPGSEKPRAIFILNVWDLFGLPFTTTIPLE